MDDETLYLIRTIVLTWVVLEIIKQLCICLWHHIKKQRNLKGQLPEIPGQEDYEEKQGFIEKQNKENQNDQIINYDQPKQQKYEQKIMELQVKIQEHRRDFQDFLKLYQEKQKQFAKTQELIFQQIFQGSFAYIAKTIQQAQKDGFKKFYQELKSFNSVQSNQESNYHDFGNLTQEEQVKLIIEENMKFVVTLIEQKIKEIPPQPPSPPPQPPSPPPQPPSPLVQQNLNPKSLNPLPSHQLVTYNAQRKKRVQEIISFLYKNSADKRHVEPNFRPFIREEVDKYGLCQNYSIRKSEIKNKLWQICNGMKYARGDGNCFYTSFGYQYLLILLFQFSEKEFDQFLGNYLRSNLPMIIKIDQNNFDNPEDQKYLLEEFLYRLQELRYTKSSETRKKVFQDQFAAYQPFDEEIDGCFYGLSTIFFRNLANKVIDKNDMVGAVYDRYNLLIWEEMCNSNEVVIQSLAKELNIQVQLIFFDNYDFKLQEYEVQNDNKIILLIRPGHYNIGIFVQEQQKQVQQEANQY